MNQSRKYPATRISRRVEVLATEIFEHVMREMTENEEDWKSIFDDLDDREKRGLFLSLADAFSDEIKD